MYTIIYIQLYMYTIIYVYNYIYVYSYIYIYNYIIYIYILIYIYIIYIYIQLYVDIHMFYAFVISFVSHQFPGSKPRPFPMTFDKPGRRDDDGMFQITNLARPSLYMYIYIYHQWHFSSHCTYYTT